MNIPFLRGLTASIGSNVATLKKQSKRLHKSAPMIFGFPVTLEQCQEALAHTIGFQCWADVTDLAIKTGKDNSLPFWHILTRNDAHAQILSALMELQIETNENGPIVLLGKAEEVATTAICLWAETISARRTPGLIMVNTEHPTLQDTAIGSAINTLGLREEFAQFRVLDVREKALPVSIHGTPMGWVRTITELLPESEREMFENTGGRHLFESAVSTYGGIESWIVERWIKDGLREVEQDVPFQMVVNAAHFLSNHKLLKQSLLDRVSGVEHDALMHDIKKYADNIPATPLKHVREIVDAVAQCEISLGPVLWQESQYRPTIVLFNQNNKASVVIAGAIHEMYYWRYVSQRAIRPILYFNDTQNTALPELIGFGSYNIIANGSLDHGDREWQCTTMRRALFGKVHNETLAFSGRKFDISSLI